MAREPKARKQASSKISNPAFAVLLSELLEAVEESALMSEVVMELVESNHRARSLVFKLRQLRGELGEESSWSYLGLLISRIETLASSTKVRARLVERGGGEPVSDLLAAARICTSYSKQAVRGIYQKIAERLAGMDATKDLRWS